jgi:hypothetical protein
VTPHCAGGGFKASERQTLYGAQFARSGSMVRHSGRTTRLARNIRRSSGESSKAGARAHMVPRPHHQRRVRLLIYHPLPGCSSNRRLSKATPPPILGHGSMIRGNPNRNGLWCHTLVVGPNLRSGNAGALPNQRQPTGVGLLHCSFHCDPRANACLFLADHADES